MQARLVSGESIRRLWMNKIKYNSSQNRNSRKKREGCKGKVQKSLERIVILPFICIANILSTGHIPNASAAWC